MIPRHLAAFVIAVATAPSLGLSIGPCAATGVHAAPADVVEPYLEIEQPSDGAVASTTPVLIRGRSSPHRVVLVIANDDDMVVAAVAPDGAFTASVDLLPGPNTVAVLSAVVGDRAAPILIAEVTVRYAPDGR